MTTHRPSEQFSIAVDDGKRWVQVGFLAIDNAFPKADTSANESDRDLAALTICDSAYSAAAAARCPASTRRIYLVCDIYNTCSSSNVIRDGSLREGE
ncbi:MAG: hypothetical protein SW833_13175 [Cyanobacteriota bacterium]|nr:hypothetical protein [Cyanobacteriota bacterium]